jgi:hypothetical protein
MIVNHLNVISIFCEDIREEIGGTFTLIGLLPDNLATDKVPTNMPKLAVFTRTMISLEVDEKIENITIELKAPNGKIIAQNIIDTDLITQSVADSRAQGAPVLTLISRMVASPFPLLQVGRFIVTVVYNGEEFFSGAINVTISGASGPLQPQQ